MDDQQWQCEYEEVDVSLGNDITGELSVIQIGSMDFFNTPGVPSIFNGVMALSVSSRLHYMQKRVTEAEAMFSRRFEAISAHDVTCLIFVLEDVVIHMKRAVDEFFAYEWLRLEGRSAAYLETGVIRVSEVNAIDSCSAGPTKDALVALRDNHGQFIQHLINMRNSFAHHPLVALSYDLVGLDHLTVNTVYTKRGDMKKLTQYSIFLEDLLKSFNRFMRAVYLEPRD
ncbi:hypothetical protein SAMN05216601_10875 [Ectopseudomonas composti]|uniref:Uncharacterized protein n=1 Tax=Ectopseudomonas composti TaxID=658457 RepID=A0A1I5P563_9GAMM|nr:hypothetical protein [Pseudomonas composti]SFP29107.1 hypothetical protein SAMN05216601_10875 [Pseudomonas composti]